MEDQEHGVGKFHPETLAEYVRCCTAEHMESALLTGYAGFILVLPMEKERMMAVKEGDRLPDVTLQELPVEYTAGCPTGPENRSVPELTL